MSDLPPMPPVPVARAPEVRIAVARGKRSWLVPAAAIAFGGLVDHVAHERWGFGFTLVAIAGAVGVILLGRPRPAATPFFVAGLALMAFVSLRASSVLQTLDTVAAVTLFAVGAGFSRAGSPLVATVRGYLTRGLAVIGSLPEGIAALGRPLAPLGASGRMRTIPRTAIVVVPILGVFAILLGTADPVFGRIISSPLAWTAPDRLPGHVVMIALGAIALSSLLARTERAVILGSGETLLVAPAPLLDVGWSALLISVNLLFAAFLAVQFAYFFGGRDRVLTQEGLTFAGYARKGFWQLLSAAILTGLLIAYAWIVGGRQETGHRRRAFTWLSSGLIVMTLIVLVSAFRRLTLYESAYGYTWLRLIVHEAIIVVGLLLACGLVAVITRRISWLPAAAVAIAFLALVVLNVSNPDASIARRNAERYALTGQIDYAVLGELGPDAAPALVELLPSLPACPRALLADDLARVKADLAIPGGWSSWNLGRERAEEALKSFDLRAHAPEACN